MANVWQDKPSIHEPDHDAMAIVLEARHGVHAAHVADFFSAVHHRNGDEDRSSAWANVAQRVRDRQCERLQS